jgi:ribosomal subunit interface protein
LRVQIATRHCKISDEALLRTTEQIEKLERYEPLMSSAEVVYFEEKHAKNIEVILHISGTAPIVGGGEGTDFRTALDRVVERLGRMLKKQRGRRLDHQAPKLSDAAPE